MADAGFSQRFRALVEGQGGQFSSDGWTSATTKSWSAGGRLQTHLSSFRPDLVIVVLGANEVFVPAPETLAPFVQRIVAQLKGRPCLWVSPPLWKGETGIVGVERANSSPCAFFDSGTLAIERAKAGIHPTHKGGADWADQVWAQMFAIGSAREQR